MSHEHSHACGPHCNHTAPVPMQQSLDEVEFEKGLWGYITRRPTAQQVEQFIESHDSSVVDKPDKSGYTPLLYAARQGDPDICRVLLLRGASVNVATRGLGQTALHRAAQQGHEAVCGLLLEYGADPSARDGSGKTAADIAAEKGFEKLHKMLALQTHNH